MIPRRASVEIAVPLSAIEREVLLHELDVVPEATRRLRVILGDRFAVATHAPRIDSTPDSPLVIPWPALAVTVAALLEADAAWREGGVRGLVQRIVEGIDSAAVAAGWV